MARTKDENLHAQRRDEILKAAARTFRRCGFHAARTQDICAEAGLSTGTVFRHFASKREMIMEIATCEYARYTTEALNTLLSPEGLDWLAHIDAEGLDTLLAPSEYELGLESWLELLRDPEWRQNVLSLEIDLRNELANKIEAGKRVGWIHGEVDSHGAADIFSAIFCGLMFDRETGIPRSATATAHALRRFVRAFFQP